MMFDKYMGIPKPRITLKGLKDTSTIFFDSPLLNEIKNTINMLIAAKKMYDADPAAVAPNTPYHNTTRIGANMALDKA